MSETGNCWVADLLLDNNHCFSFLQFPANPSPVLSVFDFDPEEIARQLTIIDFSLFSKIKPAELLNQAWQKQKYKHRAQNILRLVERMNNLTLWVATTILSQRVSGMRERERGREIERKGGKGRWRGREREIVRKKRCRHFSWKCFSLL